MLLYGIYLWADLTAIGAWAAPGQTKTTMYFSVILVTQPKSYSDDGSPRFRRQTVKVEARTGTIVKNSGIL